MRVVVVDNYDSFTYNLVHLAGEVLGELPAVVRNDEVSVHELRRRTPDAVIISPGPGHPGRAHDFGVSADVLTCLDVPVLGVCLGHQGLGLLFGAAVRHAPEPVHGRSSRVFHDGDVLFDGIPPGFHAVRYHSLLLDAHLPSVLKCLAWTADGLVMGIAHRSRPLWGVQFHPESVGTEHGHRLMRNFLCLAAEARPQPAQRTLKAAAPRPRRTSPRPLDPPASVTGASLWEGLVRYERHLGAMPDPEDAFVSLYNDAPASFWLDSSRVIPGVSRHSYMGDGRGPHAAVLTYRTADGVVAVDRAGVVEHKPGGILDVLRDQPPPSAPHDLDADGRFTGGLVGFLGYELKGDCGYPAPHASPHPDAAMIFADRVLCFDHQRHELTAFAWARPGEGDDVAAWVDDVRRRLAGCQAPPVALGVTDGDVDFTLRRDEDHYLADIEDCLRQIRDGESYEICLTNEISAPPVPNPLDLYRVLRRINPAPYASYLRFGSLTVAGSSPESFLRIGTDRRVTAKPIKGTARRSTDPDEDACIRNALATSTKDRAENLMIVDLLRNDLGRVCELGTVRVPHLMQVESYATVHQLVSTVAGHLARGSTTVDCIRAAFPGGSMTGAPKARTLEIIDRLENAARGVYSGCIGWLGSAGDGEFSIVIRTAVVTPQGTSIGVGGAIVALSDPAAEFDETLVKAAPMLRAVSLVLTGAYRPEHLALHGVRKVDGRQALLHGQSPQEASPLVL